MAIVQISRIQHRRGLKESLPQLAAGEIGFAVDTQELFIGNGPTAEGAPEIGNTKIITEDDNLLTTVNTYTFKGNTTAAVVTGASGDIQRTLQQKLDDRASVKDFGAVGDGVTDDTVAINRAIKNLMTVETTGKEKRSLYFPGGEYKISGTSIKIYPHTTIIGDGHTSTKIKTSDTTLSNLVEFVDLKGQTQANIGADGGEVPNGIMIVGVTFETSNDQNVMRLDSVQDAQFEDCAWTGPFTNQSGQTSGNALIKMFSTVANTTKRINFIGCYFEGLEYAVDVSDNVEDVLFSGCEFKTLYRGFNLAEASDGSTFNKTIGPTGFIISSSRFDLIDAEAIKIHSAGGKPHGNIFANNFLRDVGRNTDDSADVPEINFQEGYNVTFSNFFNRTDVLSNIAGSVYHESPPSNGITLADNQSSKGNITDSRTNANLQFDIQREAHIEIDYILTRNTSRRSGKLSIDGTSSSVTLVDDFNENIASGVVFFVTADGTLQFTSTNTGSASTFKYRITRFV